VQALLQTHTTEQEVIDARLLEEPRARRRWFGRGRKRTPSADADEGTNAPG